MRMLGPDGNPTAANLSSVLNKVQQASGVRLNVSTDHESLSLS